MDETTSDSPTQASEFPRAGTVVAGRYRVRARLGRGAWKEVYLAYDERLDREVALALVVGAFDNEVARDRVKREAQVTGRLGDHPNVITVHDTGEHDGVPYIVMRAMRGGSLADRLAGGARPSIADTIRLGAEIAAALAHAHAHDVVHRDVKPDNVWLAADDSAALGDFGIAHRLGSERLTAVGIVVGTVRYLSPEQIRGDEIGPASDLYALGVTLYELATGRGPFEAGDAQALLMQHLTAVPVAPSVHEPGVPDGLERLILALLAKDPAQRPASAEAVRAALAGMSGVAGAAPRPASPPRPAARRLVSVLAARAEVGDPEALHGVFDRCTAVIEQHGGTVERYLGDALVGFFGLNESHEDDALRAARAAVELRSETAELRLGIESGEVFLGTGPHGATIATGAAITAAGQLAEGAGQGEILLGEQIRRTVAADATIDHERGRLVELQIEQPALLRARATPFVDREPELAALNAAFAEVRDERICRLVTVAGPPGIGKSRLAGEFLAALGDEATVLAGRCLAYGEGTTYRALADIVRGLGGEPRQRLDALLGGDEQALRGILGAIGLSAEPAQAEETSWALRRLLERLARDGPLVVAVEDIHWAEPILLDMLDGVAALSIGSPILLLCLTRPDLLESRPQWSAPQHNRTLLEVDALGAADSRKLAECLGASAIAERIAERADGNPLFVEQLVAVDAGHDAGELPASIQAVLAARIDRLDAGERTLLRCAAVEGRTFHAGALAAVLPDNERRALGRHLVALVRKGLIGADPPGFPGEDAFRFTHALIREAAYVGVAKAARADVHAALAGWLEERPEAADEIVGYHLEQACLLRASLGHSGRFERWLATRAVERLDAASRTALVRGDPCGASALLERAIALVASDDAARGALLPALGYALFEAGRMTEAMRVLDEAVSAADPPLQARARVEREFVRLGTEADLRIEESRRVADAALPVLVHAHDAQGQSRALSLRAHVAWIAGRIALADEAWCEAAQIARTASDERELFHVLRWRATGAVLGPTPVNVAISRCEEFLEIVNASPLAVAWTHNALAVLHAMHGDLSIADRCLREARELLHQFGSLSSSVFHHEAHVCLIARRPERAEACLRTGADQLAAMGESGMLATTNAMLAQAVYAQGRRREAGELCELTAAATAEDDVVTQVIWRGVRAKVLAHDGRGDEAEALARDAVALISATDLLSHHGDAMLDLAEVLQTWARVDEAHAAMQAGLALYESKGNVNSAQHARRLLGNLFTQTREHDHPGEG